MYKSLQHGGDNLSWGSWETRARHGDSVIQILVKEMLKVVWIIWKLQFGILAELIIKCLENSHKFHQYPLSIDNLTGPVSYLKHLWILQTWSKYMQIKYDIKKWTRLYKCLKLFFACNINISRTIENALRAFVLWIYSIWYNLQVWNPVLKKLQ